MIRHDFSQFSYAVNNDSAKKGHKEILVCFMYNGSEVLKKVYIPEKAGTAYIFEAKKIIEQEMRNGDLAAYAHKFVAKNKKKDAPSKPRTSSGSKTEYVPLPPKKGLKIAFVIVCILLVGAVAAAILLFLKGNNSGPVTPEKVAITVDGNGGYWEEAGSKKYTLTFSVDKNTTWGKIKPANPKFDGTGYHFDAWTIKGESIDDSYKFVDSTTSILASTNKDRISLTFGNGEGDWKDGTPSETRTFTQFYCGVTFAEVKTACASELAVTAPSGKRFNYFSDGAGGNSPLGNKYVFTPSDSGQTFTAQYTDDLSVMHTITVDPDGGTIGTSSEIQVIENVAEGSKWGDIKPSDPTKTGNTFAGWYNGTTQITDETTIEASITVKAKYTPKTLDVVFNRGEKGYWSDGETGDKKPDIKYGETFADVKAKAEYGESYFAITPEDNWAFKYFQDESGNPISDSYVFADESEVVITAQYEPLQPYDLFIVVDAAGGTFASSGQGVDSHMFRVQQATPYITGQNIFDEFNDASREGYGINKWEYKSENTWYELGAATQITSSTSVRIVWTADIISSIKFNVGEHGTWTNAYEGSTEPARDFANIIAYDSDYYTFRTEHADYLAITNEKGYQFVYFVSDADGHILGDSHKFVEGESFTAYYEDAPLNMTYVSVDLQGGSLGGSTETILYDIDIGSTWKDAYDALELNNVQAPTGKNFDLDAPWLVFVDGDWEQITNDYVIEVPTQVKANYLPIKVTVTLNPGEGTWTESGDQEPKTIEVDYGQTYGEVVEPYIGEGEEYHVTPPTINDVATYFKSGDEIIGHFHPFTVDGETLIMQYIGTSDSVTITLDPNDPDGNAQIAGKNDPFDITIPKNQPYGEIKGIYTPNAIPLGCTQFNFYRINDPDTGAEVTDTTTFNSGDTLYATYEQEAPGRFQDDSWTTLNRIANQGLEALHNTYHDALQADGTLVGATRYEYIGGQPYTIRVIGEGEDTYNGSGKKASLTFQFATTVPIDGLSYASYSSTSNNNYENSRLRSYLNNQFLASLSEELQLYIKGVNKSTYNFGTSAVESTVDSIFPLSMKEAGFVDGDVPSQQEIVQNEGNAYTYWANHKTDSDRIYRFGGSPVAYWLRSPSANTEFGAWCVGEDGKLGLNGDIRQAADISVGLGVAPAFCIGELPA